MRIERVVLTGGPCGGKSEAAMRVRDHFAEKGWTVLTIAETATELILGGIAPWTCPDRKSFQQAQMRLQTAKEDLYLEYAARIGGERTLVLMDRGTVDSRAFLGSEVYSQAVRELGLNEKDLLARYDLVCHLTSAAGSGHYTTKNNTARREGEEEAASLDADHLAAWADHPRRIVVPSFPDFEEKMAFLLRELDGLLE